MPGCLSYQCRRCTGKYHDKRSGCDDTLISNLQLKLDCFATNFNFSIFTDLAINWNPTEYASRLIDSEAEKSCWMTLLPIFYYNETLFPGSRLDLHLFEPRYRVMMQRVVNTTRSFAYVPNFNQYRANVGDVALVAVLEEVEFMADGRCMLQAKLSSRMTITEHYGQPTHLASRALSSKLVTVFTARRNIAFSTLFTT